MFAHIYYCKHITGHIDSNLFCTEINVLLFFGDVFNKVSINVKCWTVDSKEFGADQSVKAI